jgi:ABC-type bacteriocin/lantibiotic exporter with double-glycine peptidase domain
LGIGPTRLELREVVLQPVFRSLDLTIEPGERIAVLGANGAGKSTLLRLIAGIVQPDQGEVLVDSENISRVRWSDLRHAFAMVAPDLPLLRGSLRLNLTYGSSGVDDARMAEILAACQLETLVARLPAGLDTRLAEEGGGLSTGERARIAVARALLVRPRVLLLDEADANLDQVSRAALDNLLATFTGTIVFVTHDLASVALADKVVELHSGTLTEIPPGEVAARLAALRGTRNTHDLRLVS